MLHILIATTTCVLSLGLGIFLHFWGRHRAALSLALYSDAVCVWALGKLLMWSGILPGFEIIAARISIGAAILIPLLYLWFIFRFFQEERQYRALLMAYLCVAGIFSLWNIGPALVAGVAISSGTVVPTRGPLYGIFMLYFIWAALLGLWRLFAHLQEPSPVRRNQIIYVLCGSVIGFVGGGAAFASMYGWNVHPGFFALVPLYTVVALLAIWRHRLLDVEVAFRKGIATSIVLALSSGIYLFSLLLLQDFLKGFTQVNALIISFLVALFAVLLMDPLRKKMEGVVDYLLFPDQMFIEKELTALSERLIGVLDLHELLRTLLLALVQTLTAKGVAVFLIDGHSEDLIFQAGIGMNGVMEKVIHPESEIGETIRRVNHPLHVEELVGLEEHSFRSWLRSRGIHLVMPIQREGRWGGAIFLKGKRRGLPYTLRDVGILRILLTQAAVALENARMHELMLTREQELAKTQRLAMIGSLAAGLAHEIKNPLASIKGLTGVLPENIDDPEFMERFGELVPRQIDRIQMLLERMLRAGRAETVTEWVPAGEAIQEVVRLIEYLARRQQVELGVDTGRESGWLVPREEFTQIFLNLALNALEAMPQGGQLHIQSLAEDEIMIFRVKDTGKGIPAQLRDRIFDSFFTTKAKGSGLGLFVVRHHVMRMHGTIEVQSEENKGSCFVMRFPLKMESQIHPEKDPYLPASSPVALQ